jgi:hypothetical protein
MPVTKHSYRYLLLILIGFAALASLAPAPAVVRSLTAGFGLVGGGTGNVTLGWTRASSRRG